MPQQPNRATQAIVDSQLIEQGAYSPLDLLLNTGRLVYTDYERWRRGELESLDDVLRGNPQKIKTQLESADHYARTLQLVAEQQEFFAWRAPLPLPQDGVPPDGSPQDRLPEDGQATERKTSEPKLLRVSVDKALQELLSVRFVSQQQSPQLDMFFDNPVVAIVNELAAALASGHGADAQHSLDKLYQQSPNHSDLAAYDQLIDVLRHSAGPVSDSRQPLLALQQAAPIAKRILGGQARDFMVPLWRRLAQHLTDAAFIAEQADLHLSYALLQAQDWAGASTAIQATENWWRYSVLCLRLAESAYRQQDSAQTLCAWFYLCWQFPDVAAQSLGSNTQPDPGMARRWHQFLDSEAELDPQHEFSSTDFPAWLLITEPGLIHILMEDVAKGESAPEQVYRLSHQLFTARHNADAKREMDLRKQLQEHHPGLFEYLKTRL